MLAALTQLEQTLLPPNAKKQLRAMLEAAANPDAENPVTVMRTLEPERKLNAIETARQVSTFQRQTAARGRQRLFDMSDDEFNALVDDEPTP